MTSRIAMRAAVAAFAAGLPWREAPADEWSANFAFASEYVFRGYSQTGNTPALQGGLDWLHDDGWYVGAWGSNVESDPGAPVNYDDASIEVDVYGGWRGGVGEFTWDIGALRYEYPGTGTNAYNTDEIHLGFTREGRLSLGGFLYYSPDYFGAGDAWYGDLIARWPLGDGLGLALHYGWTEYTSNTSADDYADLRLSLTKSLDALAFELAYIDTAAVDGLCSNESCDPGLVIKATILF